MGERERRMRRVRRGRGEGSEKGKGPCLSSFPLPYVSCLVIDTFWEKAREILSFLSSTLKPSLRLSCCV
jgi:hypothetical protein